MNAVVEKLLTDPFSWLFDLSCAYDDEWGSNQ